jgi:Tfp pilus assembly protein PilN
MSKVNLLPPELSPERRKQSLADLAPAIAWRAGAAVVVLGYSTFLFTLFSAQGVLEERRTALERLAPEVAAAQELQQERERAEAMLAAWRKVFLEREDLVYLLEDVNAGVPAAVWLTALEIAPGEETAADEPYPRPSILRIEGRSRSLAAVGAFVQNLNRRPYFSGVVLQEVREEGDGVLSFKISTQLARSSENVAAPD